MESVNNQGSFQETESISEYIFNTVQVISKLFVGSYWYQLSDMKYHQNIWIRLKETRFPQNICLYSPTDAAPQFL